MMKLSSWFSKYAGPLCLSFAAVMLFCELGQGYLFNPWEPNYGGVVNEMLERDNLLEPRWLGGYFPSKPIGLFWLAIPTVSLFGSSPLTLRAPVALLALIGLVFLYRLGLLLGGRRTGVFSVLVGSTLTGYVLLARQYQMDMPTAALNVGVVALAAEVALVENLTRFRIRLRVMLIYLFVAITLLMKGLVGPFFAVCEILLIIVLTRKWKLFLTFLDWRGFIVFSVVGLPWFIYMHFNRPDFLQTFIFEHHFKRAAAGLYSRDFDWSFTVHHVGLSLTPWLALTPLIGTRKAQPADPLSTTVYRIGWIGFCVPFFLFALTKTKFAHYFLASYPFFALLIGHALARISSDVRQEHKDDPGSRISWGIILALMTTGIAAMGVKDVIKNHTWPFRTFSPEKLPVGFNSAIEGIGDIYLWSLGIFAFGTMVLLIPKSPFIKSLGAGILVLSAVMQVGGYAWWAMPRISKMYSVQPLIEEIKEEDPDAEFAAYSSWVWESMGYYQRGGKGQIRNPNAAANWLAGNPGHRYLITETRPARSVSEIFARKTGAALEPPLISRNLRVVLGNRSKSLEEIISKATLKKKPKPKHRARAEFNNGLELLGYDLKPETPKPGEQLIIRLYFYVKKPTKEPFNIFIHMEKEFRARVAILNRTPMGGAYLTNKWKAGTYVRDDITVDLPDDLPAEIRFYTGFFNNKGRATILSGHQDGEKRVNAGIIKTK